MPRAQRSGCLRVSRSVKQQAADTLSLAEYGLLNRIWDDLRWTPCQVRIKNVTFDLKAGQAVISMAGYATQFRCHQGTVAAALRTLEADGWFAVERSRKGTVVTCLRDPRGEPDPAGGEVIHRAKNLPPVPGEGGGSAPCAEPGSSAGREPHNKDVFCSTPGGSTPTNNDTGAALRPPAFSETPRARDGVVAPVRSSERRCVCAECGKGCRHLLASCFPDLLPPEPPPQGGRPAPKAPVDQSAPSRPEVVHSQRAAPAPVSAVLDEILRPHPELVQAAWPAGVPLPLVAQAVLERRDQVEVLAVLLCARAKRQRLRSTAAFFRAKVLCRPLGAAAAEPRLCDWTEAKRLLVGAGLPEDPRARQAIRAIGAVLRDGQGRRPADAWREAAAARAALRRAQDLEQLRQNLHDLHGERRRWAEQLLAGESSPQRTQSARRTA